MILIITGLAPSTRDFADNSISLWDHKRKKRSRNIYTLRSHVLIKGNVANAILPGYNSFSFLTKSILISRHRSLRKLAINFFY